jgi:hypothetical protein
MAGSWVQSPIPPPKKKKKGQVDYRGADTNDK